MSQPQKQTNRLVAMDNCVAAIDAIANRVAEQVGPQFNVDTAQRYAAAAKDFATAWDLLRAGRAL